MLRLAAGKAFPMLRPRISATHAPSSEKMKNTSNQVGALLSVLGIERHPAPRFRPAQTLVRIPPAPAGRACSRRPVGAMKINDLTSLALFGQKCSHPEAGKRDPGGDPYTFPGGKPLAHPAPTLCKTSVKRFRPRFIKGLTAPERFSHHNK